MKAGLRDTTVATPMSLFSRTIRPPAALIAARAAAFDAPDLYTTTYCVGLPLVLLPGPDGVATANAAVPRTATASAAAMMLLRTESSFPRLLRPGPPLLECNGRYRGGDPVSFCPKVLDISR